MTSALYYTALRMAGLPQGIRRIRNAAVILCYHNVVADDSPDIGDPSLHMSQTRFHDQLRWLTANYTVVSLHDLLRRVTAAKSLRGLAALTFDDAYNGVFEYARPLLAQFACPATVFVVTSAPSDGMGFWWDHPATRSGVPAEQRRQWFADLRGDRQAILAQLRAPLTTCLPRAMRPAGWATLAQRDPLIELGVHSATHRVLPRLTDSELVSEVVASRDVLQEKTGASPGLFSYPYGLWDRRVREVVKRAGYVAAVSLDRGLASRRSDPWTLPRINIPRTIGTPAFEAWTAGLGR